MEDFVYMEMTKEEERVLEILVEYEEKRVEEAEEQSFDNMIEFFSGLVETLKEEKGRFNNAIN